MSEVSISPIELNGSVTAPPSKSDAHRAIICASLVNGMSEVSPINLSNDIKATIAGIYKIGAKVQLLKDKLIINGTDFFSNKLITINCMESGSTLRFLIPILAAKNINALFKGIGQLPKRPIGVYLDLLPKFGVSCSTSQGLPLEICGQLKPGIFELPGDISSQFISGLLLALPLLMKDSQIILTSKLCSSGYVDMTIETMKKFGVNVEKINKGWRVLGKQTYSPCCYNVEGDWSQAAFFMAAGAIKGKVRVFGLNHNSKQGDMAIIDILKEFGAIVNKNDEFVEVSHKELHGIHIDGTQIPDIIPVIAVVASLAKGTTKINGVSRLKIKESDRLSAICSELTKMGANILKVKGSLIINGVEKLNGAKLNGFNDHRIVMALAIAAVAALGDVFIKDSQSIDKSYPNFFKDYKSLGGIINVINMG